VSRSDGVASVWFFLFGEGEWGGLFFLFSFLGLVAMPLAHAENGDKEFWK
jgi:hypothetical protein